MDLEARILRLAQDEGLLDPDALQRTLPLDSDREIQTLCWGPRVDALVNAGLLKEADAVRLALLADADLFRSEALSGLDPETLPRTQGTALETSAHLPEWRVPPGERYEILNLVGEGGMGRVYKARDKVLDRIVALKFIRAFLPTQLQRVLREARNQARLEHPGICRVYEVGEAWGTPFIAMQFLEGEPLHLAARELPLEGKLDLVRQVAEAIHAAHREGLIHRDLKPGNILVTRDTEDILHPHVVDFGLAVDLDAPHLTHAGTAIGTPAYMSPEQAVGKLDQVDRRSDVWSLGVILFELLTGDLPFHGDSALDLLVRVQQEEAPRPASLRPDLPKDVATIIETCLHKEPGRRYESARALAEDLQRFLDGEPIRARASGHLERTGLWIRRHRALAAALAVALLALLSGAAVVAWQRSRAREQAFLALQFSQAVQELELTVTTLHTLPPRDLSGGMAQVRRRLADLEQQIAQSGKMAQGPGHAALGRGYLALDEYTKAREHYEKAESLRYRTPETRLGLGLVLSALHQQGMAGAWLLSKDRRELRVQELETQLKPRILQCLREGARASMDHDLVPIRLQAAEGKLPEALQALRTLVGTKPWITGAWRLLVELQVADFERQSTQGQAPEVPEACLQALAEARQILRGDPALSILEARIHIVDLRRGFDSARLDEAARDKVLAVLELAKSQDPEREDVLALRAEVEARLGTFEANVLAGESAHLRLGRELCEKALQQNPNATWARELLLNLHAVTAYAYVVRTENLKDPRPHVEAATGHYRALSALAQGGVREGIRAFDMAIAHWGLGMYLQNTNQPAAQALDQAISYAEKAVTHLPGKGACRSILASVLKSRALEEEDPRPWREKALRIFEELRLQEPNNPNGSFNKAIGLCGLAAWELDNLGLDPAPRVQEAVSLFEKVATMTPAMEPLTRIGRIEALLVQARWKMLRGEDPSPEFARIHELARPLPEGQQRSALWPVRLQEARWKILRGKDPGPALAPFLALQRQLEPTLREGALLPEADARILEARGLRAQGRAFRAPLEAALQILDTFLEGPKRDQAELPAIRTHLFLSLTESDPGSSLDRADAILRLAEQRRIQPPETRLLRAVLDALRAKAKMSRPVDGTSLRKALDDLTRRHPTLTLEAQAFQRELER